ncbi:MAG: glycoside hydrolase family 5 protein [Roseburia sp.]|nr:glycoside hydrolase family 5 protein [Roseburia sp.]MCM1099403.1 glycoside hydrolase family 5 protein [Ruminococcus flavefaciens]
MTEAMELVKKIRAGVSIGDTLDSVSASIPADAAPSAFETAWHNPVITQGLVDAILKSGFNLVRFPVSWSKHLGSAPDFRIQDSWLDRIQEVVDYAYGRGAYVILNLHHEDWNYPYYDNCQAACEKMKAVWGQICERFADYDERLIFEAQNEPRKVGTELEWNGGDEEGWEVVNATNRAFLETVRAAGGYNPERYVLLPGYAANCTTGIQHLQMPEDARAIVSVHAYEPYEFALEFPGRNTWDHDTEKIDSLMESLKELFTGKGIPVIIGEFGARNKDGNEDERAEWVRYYVDAAAAVGVPCVWWDNGRFEGNGELFGLFDRYDYRCVYPKVLDGLLRGNR